METAEIEKLESVYSHYRDGGGSVISILQHMQEVFGYIPQDAVNWFSDRTGIPESKFFGVATFYAQFHLKPRGKNIVTACCGTACHVKGSDRIISRLRDDLGLSDGESTTADGEFTLEKVACVGACSIAPVVIVNRKVFGKMTPDKTAREMKNYKDKGSE